MLLPALRGTARLATSRAARALSTQHPGAGYVLGMVGPDQLGIVSKVTKVVHEAGGSVAQSNSAALFGTFNVSMKIDIPPSADAAAIRRQVWEALPNHQVSILEAIRTEADAFVARFDVSMADHPGVMNQVTSLMASHQLSVNQIVSAHETAPFGGTTLFTMSGVVSSPSAFDAATLLKDLAELERSKGIEVKLEILALDEPEAATA